MSPNITQLFAGAAGPPPATRGDGGTARGAAKRSGDAHWTHRMPERIAQGDRNVASEEDVRLIFDALARGVKQNIIAEALDVTTSIVNRIAKGKTWQHVTGGTPAVAHGNAKKLTPELVLRIRAMADAGVGFTEIGRQLGVSNVTAANVGRRLTWRDVPEAADRAV